jgi:glycosyltransferase involved in cell wall biosynthesis
LKVVYASSLERGGPLSHLRDLAPQVAAQGLDVTVLCASEPVAAGFRESGVEAVVVPLRHKLDVAGAARVWRHLDADVVHTHDRRTGLLVRPQGRARAAKVVHTLHGMPEEIALRVGRNNRPVPPGVSRARLAWLLHGYLRIESLLGRLGTVVVPSDAIRRFLVEQGLAPGRIHVIPSGITVGPTKRRAVREPVVAATAANLEYWKGIDVLLEACARLQRPVRVEIFGEGSQRAELEARAGTLGIAASFHGFVDDLKERLDDVDLFVLPSRAENFPIAILEAMASGLPVVSTRVGGVPELVSDGDTGLLVEPDDASGLAAAIDRLAGDAELRRAFGERGARRAKDEFGAADTARRMVRLYEQLHETR